jgi:type IV pilus assembly protein PilX
MSTKHLNFRGNGPRRQSGAALVIGLILLLIITVFAISGMATAALELLMAGNEQYQERAFQAADAGVERAVLSGIYNTNVSIGNYVDDDPVDPFDEPQPIRGSGVSDCVQQLDEDGEPTGDSDDCYEYFMRFDDVAGTTAVPGGGYSLGTGFEAYHFVVDSYGTSNRGAASDHTQSFYVVGPGGT